MTVGVLALQGAVSEHLCILSSLGAAAREVRFPEDFSGLDGLVIPGGESTTLEKLMKRFGLHQPLAEALDQGMGVWGTCAGMILLARSITNAIPGQLGLGHLPISVERNAFGRQVESCEIGLGVKGVEGGDFPAVFIRAPAIVEVLDPEVDLLADYQGRGVAARYRKMLATSFHPELTQDHRLHQLFLDCLRN